MLDAFNEFESGPPTDLAAFLRQQPEPGMLPLPWETWTLIGLVRHRERQLWVAEIVQTRLRGDISRIAEMGAMGHPEELPQSGSVPGLSEWEFYFHGIGCCLTHKVKGDSIDVDFYVDSAEYFDPYFYSNYLESVRSPEPPELRLRELFRSLRPLKISIDELTKEGGLSPLPESSNCPRVSTEVLLCERAINSFCQAWENITSRLWLAALIGDWVAARACATGDPTLEQLTTRCAEKVTQLRGEQLRNQTGHVAADALYGLEELNAADRDLESAFQSNPSGLVSAALEIVEQRDGAQWCPQVFALFRRVNPRGPIPEPHIWMASLKYLLRRGFRRSELLDAIPRAGGAEIGEAILLALENRPEYALPLIRKGLLAEIPMDRTVIAAILALIDRPWSTRELLRALESSSEQEQTADARAALLELGTPSAEQAVAAWEARNPHEAEPGSYIEIDGRRLGPFNTISEQMLKHRAVWLRFEMEQLHDRVMTIRHVIPPEPVKPRPWWKLWG